jgi:hypothetical protein
VHSEIEIFFREPSVCRIKSLRIVLAGSERKRELLAGAVRVRPTGLSSSPTLN